MKPNWSKAPDWAQWFAVDESGTGYWHEKKPEKGRRRWYIKTEGRSAYAAMGDQNLTWFYSLEERPKMKN